MTPTELQNIRIEISVLTPITPITSLDAFILGTHGIIIEKDGRSGVFLPQVATEQEWDKDQTLSQLCLKAGLSASAYKQGASFKVFSADVFHEQ